MMLSTHQLDLLDRELDRNRRELLILPVRESLYPLRQLNPFSPPTGNPPHFMCGPEEPSQMDHSWQAAQAGYNSTVHAFANTSWGVPSMLGAYDAYNLKNLARDIGGFGTKVRISVHKGRQYLILTGYPGLRNKLRGTRYGIQNPRLIEMGVGRYGIRGTSISGFKLSCYVSVGIEALEWIFDDNALMTDLFGGIGVELIKAGIASALGYAAAMGMGVGVAFATLPVLVGAVVVLAVGITLNAIDNHYAIKTKVKSALREAVDNIGDLPERFEARANETVQKLEHGLENISARLAEFIYDEAKSWILRKLPSNEGHPRPPRIPDYIFIPRLLKK